jgi:chromosome segregation ATPase
MGKVYESLREAMQEKFQRNKAVSASPQVDQAEGSGVGQELREFQKIVLDRIGRLAVLVENDEKLAQEENQHAEQLITGLRENLTAATAKLRETENILSAKDSARQNLEETLTARIRGFQDEMKKKDELIERKEGDIKNLTSTVGKLEAKVLELETAVERARTEMAQEVQRAEQLSEKFRATSAEFETQLKEAEQIVREKDSTVKRLEQELAGKMQEFSAKISDHEAQLKNKEQSLESRDGEIKDLKSQLQFLTRGIDELSSFFMQAKALTAAEVKQKSTPLSEPVNAEAGKPPIPVKDQRTTMTSAATLDQPVSADLLHRVTERLELTIGPAASTVIRDQAAALGESIENFPRNRLIELVDVLSNEIPNKELRFNFRKWFAQQSMP